MITEGLPIIRRVVAIAAFATVSACRSSSDAHPCTDDSECTLPDVCYAGYCEVPPDLRPQVMGVTPAIRTGLAVGTPLTFSFSEPVQIADGGVTIFPADAGAWTLSTDGRALTTAPVCVTPGRVSVWFETPIRDLTGNSIEPAFFDFDYPLWLDQQVPRANPSGTAGVYAIAADDQGRLIVSFFESGGAPPLLVSRVDADGGTLLGGGPVVTTTHRRPVVAAGGGQLAVAWDDSSAGVVVRTWNGTAWIPLGPAVFPPGIRKPSMAIDPSGRPVIAFNESNTHARVFRWSGSAWAELGTLPTVGSAGFIEATVVIAADGEPEVSYGDTSSTSTPPDRLWIKKWTGSAWVDATSGAVDVDKSMNTVFLLDGAGREAVLYTGVGTLNLTRWNGAAWSSPTQLDLTNSADPGLLTATAVPGAGLFVCWDTSDRRLHCAEETATGWSRVANATDNFSVLGTRPFVAATPGGKLWFVWGDVSPGQFHVQRLNR